MAVRVAINGMGVIGREMFRQLWGKEGFEIVLLNDLVPSTNLAYLLQYDSVYHGWNDMIGKIVAKNDGIEVEGKLIHLYNESDPNNLPLGENRIDVVIECSGFFSSKERMQGFINAGARKVVSCDYCGNDLPTIAFGVNQQTIRPEDNVVACPPMELQVAAAVLNAVSGCDEIQGAIVKAYRSFTNAQYTLDNYNSKEFVRGRSAIANITPVSDGFAKGIGLVIPALSGKVIGFAYRSPVTNGSVLDLTILLPKYYTVKDINNALKAACSESLGYSEENLCSSDAMSFSNPQVLSLSTMTTVTGDSTLVSISVVYDNIRGHCNAVANVVKYFAELY